MPNSPPNHEEVVNRAWYCIFGIVGAFIAILQLKEEYQPLCFKITGLAAILLALFFLILDHKSNQPGVYKLLNVAVVLIGAILFFLPTESIKSIAAVAPKPTPSPSPTKPSSVEAVIEEGQRLYTEGKYRETIEKLEGVTSSSDAPMAHYLSGSSHLRVRPGPECDGALEHIGRLKGPLRDRLADEYERANCRDN